MKFEVYSKVGEHKPQHIAAFDSEKEAKAAKRIYEKADQNEIKEGYGFPHGLPVYEVRQKLTPKKVAPKKAPAKKATAKRKK